MFKMYLCIIVCCYPCLAKKIFSGVFCTFISLILVTGMASPPPPNHQHYLCVVPMNKPYYVDINLPKRTKQFEAAVTTYPYPLVL